MLMLSVQHPSCAWE